MSLFEHPDYDNHEHVSFYQDHQTGLRAIIAVHNTNLGASLGGCRMWQYANSDDALSDVLRLSRGMSYKAAMAKLPQGGGKAVIIGDPRTQKTPELMNAMGRFVDGFNGSYITAEDSGMSVQDIQQMATQTPHVAGHSARYSVDGNPPNGNPAPATSYGVFCGIKAAVEHRFQSDLQGKKVAIKGVGNVGLRLAEHLHKAGAILYVADVYEQNLLIAQREYNATIVDTDSIHALDVDVFAPCALGGAISAETINDIQAKVIAGAANNQLATEDMDARLQQLNITYVPDYVINAGGIIDIYQQRFDNSSDQELRAKIEQIGSTVTDILEHSTREGIPAQSLANKLAREYLQLA